MKYILEGLQMFAGQMVAVVVCSAITATPIALVLASRQGKFARLFRVTVIILGAITLCAFLGHHMPK